MQKRKGALLTEKKSANHWPKRTYKLTLTGWSKIRLQQTAPDPSPSSSNMAKMRERACILTTESENKTEKFKPPCKN